MTLTRAAVLRPGDWVRFDGGDHQVVALAGTSVRLRSGRWRASRWCWSRHLMASPEFAVIDGAPAPAVEPFGLLDGLPAKVLDEAREWERHIVEVETGSAARRAARRDTAAGLRPGEHDDAAAGPSQGRRVGVSVRTVQTRRARYAQQGLWGLVDQRAVRAGAATGRADARLVAAIREVIDAETDTSTGTRSRLIRRVGEGGRGHLRAGCRAAAGQDDVLQGDRRARHWPAHVRFGGDAAADREPAAGHVHPDARGPAG